MNATERLGAFVAGCGSAKIEDNVIERAAICLLDALGLGLLAHDEQTFLAVRDTVTSLPNGPARIWADGTRGVLSEVVTANALGVHALFHDDSDYSSGSHPGSLIVPLAVGVGEAGNRSLDTVLRSILAGYAALSWLGAEKKLARTLIVRGFRTSPTLGTIGAAATASVGLGLTAAQAASAVGMASCFTGGVLEPVLSGSDEWRVQNAHAARGGLLAAQLAQRGTRGAPNALEGMKGFLRILVGTDTPPESWSRDPRFESILNIYAKPWATLGDNMGPVRAAKLFHEEGVKIADIRAIRVKNWRAYTEYPGTGYKGPFDTTVQALASTSFATAAMLAYGRLDYDINLRHRQDAKILDLIKLITIEPSDEGTYLDASVELELADGTRVMHRAAESPHTWLFQDAKTATTVLEQRLQSVGFPRGVGTELAETVLGAAVKRSPLPIAAVLDRLSRPAGIGAARAAR